MDLMSNMSCYHGYQLKKKKNREQKHECFGICLLFFFPKKYQYTFTD